MEQIIIHPKPILKITKMETEEPKFKYSEKTYLHLLIKVEDATGLKLTEAEAGLCRALLDIITNGEKGACVGHHFKKEFSRFCKLGLIHAETFKHTGVCVPDGKLEKIINLYKAAEQGKPIRFGGTNPNY